MPEYSPISNHPHPHPDMSQLSFRKQASITCGIPNCNTTQDLCGEELSHILIDLNELGWGYVLHQSGGTWVCRTCLYKLKQIEQQQQWGGTIPPDDRPLDDREGRNQF